MAVTFSLAKKDLEKSRSNSTALPMVKCGIYQPVWISAFPILWVELHLETTLTSPFFHQGNRFPCDRSWFKATMRRLRHWGFRQWRYFRMEYFWGKNPGTSSWNADSTIIWKGVRHIETSMRIFSWYSQWRSIWGIQWGIDHHFLVMMLHHLWGSSRNQTRGSFFHPQFWHFCLKQSNQNGDRIQNV